MDLPQRMGRLQASDKQVIKGTGVGKQGDGGGGGGGRGEGTRLKKSEEKYLHLILSI